MGRKHPAFVTSSSLPWLVAPFVASLFLACSSASAQTAACRPASPDPFRGLDAPADLRIDEPIHTPDACPSWRWVGVKRRAYDPCPDPGPAGGASWIIEPLFATDDPQALPPVLRPFCLYRTVAADPATREALNRGLEGLLRRGSLREVVSGCAAVAPAAESTANPAGPWPILRDHFLALAGRFAPREIPSRGVGGRFVSSPEVRLALLDTQPSGLQGRGNSPHGFTLARIIRQLICSGGAGDQCAARVVPRLALPISGFSWSDPTQTTFDWESGGYFGTIDQLAQAVWGELSAWGEGPEKRLVINVSVGWIGEHFGGWEDRVSRMPAPVRALYRALEVASCRGALVVAATGNRLGGPLEQSGPLLPGGWETRAAPTVRECERILGPDAARRWESRKPRSASARRSRDGREPLVYAVAGSSSDGSPLANARPGSIPPRVAYADHAVITSPGGRGLAAVLTGSSVATSVVAATAAAVWQHRPELSRGALMSLIERSAESLERRADFHLGPPNEAPAVRRVAVCPALEMACEGGKCGPFTFDCKAPIREPPRLSELPGSCRSVSYEAARRLDAKRIDESMVHEFCGTDAIHFDPSLGLPPDPCPLRQYFAIQARPWTGPQPQTHPCVGCEVRPPPPVALGGGELTAPSADLGDASSGGYRLKIDVDQEWPGGKLASAVLRVGDEAVALGGIGVLDRGDCVLVEGIDPVLFERGEDGRLPPATLRFLVVQRDRQKLESDVLRGGALHDGGLRDSELDGEVLDGSASGVIGAIESPVFVAR